jgi:hypothetical protein
MAWFFNEEKFSSDLNTQQNIGEGKKNTGVILSFLASRGEWNRAAQVCDELEINGFDDWFLPSFLELSLLYGNLHRKGLGGFRNDPYWSSTIRQDGSPYNPYYPVAMNFADGLNEGYWPNRTSGRVNVYVRAIRQF